MTTWELRGDEPVSMPDGSLRVLAPGLTGSLEVDDGTAGATRAMAADPLDAALAAQGLTVIRSLDLDLAPARTRAWPVESGAGMVTLDAPAPPAGYAPLALAVDEGGGCRWHRPVAERGLASDTVRYALPLPPAPAERGLVVRFLRKSVRMLLYPLTDPLLGPLAEGFVRRWEARHRPSRLLGVTPEGIAEEKLAEVSAEDLASWSPGPALLLLHGTFSTTAGSFHGLPLDLLDAWSRLYGRRLLAFDHPSVSVDPDVNARALAERLAPAPSLQLDVLGYSRGGLVARAFDRELRRQDSGHRLGKLAYVGSPNAGTPLAAPDCIDDLLDRATTVFHLVPGIALGARLAIESVITVVKAIAHGALKELEGLAAMDPQGAWLAGLNRGEDAPVPEAHAIGADFEPRRQGLWTFVKDHVADAAVDGVFGREPNDLVVGARAVYAENGAAGFPVPAESRHVYAAVDGISHGSLVAAPQTADLLRRWLVPAVTSAPVHEGSPDRTALVIGNSEYGHAPLRNPANDARRVAAALRDVGFDVQELVDVPTRAAFHDAVRAFRDRLSPNGAGLFYFAGHGIQVAGRNYLLPTEADVRYEDEVTDHALDMETPLRAMQAAGCRPSVVLLDCCRDNPFHRQFRSAARGLATVVAPADAFIAYATGPGETAQDGAGPHSPFTAALLEHLGTPGLGIEALLKRVMRTVRSRTSPPQIPWFSTSFDAEFVFRPGGDASDAEPVPSPSSPVVAVAEAIESEAPAAPHAPVEADSRRRWVASCPAYLENNARALGRGALLTFLGSGMTLPGDESVIEAMRAGQLGFEWVGFLGERLMPYSVTGLLIEGRTEELRNGTAAIDDLSLVDEMDRPPSVVFRHAYEDGDLDRARQAWAEWMSDRRANPCDPEYVRAGDALLPEAMSVALLDDSEAAHLELRDRRGRARTVEDWLLVAAGYHFLVPDARLAAAALDRAAQLARTAPALCALAVARMQMGGDLDGSRAALERAASYRKEHHLPAPLLEAETWKRVCDDDAAARAALERAERAAAAEAPELLALARTWQTVLADTARARLHLTRAEDVASRLLDVLDLATAWAYEYEDLDRANHLVERAASSVRNEQERSFLDVARRRLSDLG